MKFSQKAMLVGLSLVFITAIETNAQLGFLKKLSQKNQYSTAGFGGGSSHYFGDLSSYRLFYVTAITAPRWNLTANYTRFFTPNFGARVSFSYIRLMGDDYSFWQKLPDTKANMDRLLRNLHFRNDLKEFTFTGIYNFGMQDTKKIKARKNIVPYVFGGVGFYAHNPQAREAYDVAAGKKGDWTNLKPLLTAGQGLSSTTPKPYSLVQVVFPVGMGVKWKINDRFDLAFEGSFRITPFDYLDDVGDDFYPALSTLTSALTPQQAAFSNRAGEDYAARTGISRVNDFANAAYTHHSLNYPAPSAAGTGMWGPTLASKRGSSTPDTYVVTQITLNYYINRAIQCPPIK